MIDMQIAAVGDLFLNSSKLKPVEIRKQENKANENRKGFKYPDRSDKSAEQG